MSICDEIKKRYIRLSRGQRKVAQFIIDNPNIIASHIASEVGQLIGVSESTVIRFCYAMDLSGFSELQEKIKYDLLEVSGEIEENNSSVAKKKDRYHSKVMNRDVSCILHTIELMDEKQYIQAVKQMHESHSIYVVGFRQSYPIASFLTSTLKNFRKHVKQIHHDVENIVQQISSMNKNSLLIVIALDTVLEDAMTIAKLAKNKNVQVMAITNSSLSPIRDYADIMFTVGAQKNASGETITASCSLTQALVDGMISQNKKQYTSFQKSISQLENDFLFLEKSSSM